MCHEPFEQIMLMIQQNCPCTERHTAKSMFLILCFGPVGTGSHGNQTQRREKSSGSMAELHPTGSHAKTHESHDKNNIPLLSDITLKEFLLNRGISQGAYLIVLKPSAVMCECDFFSRSKARLKKYFAHTWNFFFFFSSSSN